MAYIVMACIVMACIIMAYIAMAFRSFYSFFPRRCEAAWFNGVGVGRLLNADGTDIEWDPHCVDDWSRLRLGLFAAKPHLTG